MTTSPLRIAVTLVSIALFGVSWCACGFAEDGEGTRPASRETGEDGDEIVVTFGFLRDASGKRISEEPLLLLDGTVSRVSDWESELQDVVQNVQQSGREPSRVTVVVRADKDTPTAVIHRFIQLCQKAGFERFAIKAQDKATVLAKDSKESKLPLIKIRLRANEDGSLASVILGRRNLGNDEKVFEKLNREVVRILDSLDVPRGSRIEFQVHPDYELRHQHTIEAIGACSQFADRQTGKPGRYDCKIKFVKPQRKGEEGK